MVQILDKKARFVGVDAFRYIAFIAVALSHVNSHKIWHVEVGAVLDHMTRFAVPFFFIVSGYFLGRRNPDTFTGIIQLLKRLAPVFIFWYVLYVVASGDTALWRNPVALLSGLVTGGVGYHLWFLPALGMSAICVLITRHWGWPVAFCLAIAFYSIGLIEGSYREVLGLPYIGSTRNGPFFGFFFVLVGYWYGQTRYEIRSPVFVGTLLLLGGFMLFSLEAYGIMAMGQGRFAPYNFLIGSILFGMGTFLLALHCSCLQVDVLAKLGKLSLGMYSIHVLFIWWGERLFSAREGMLDLMALALFVIAGSTLSTLFLVRVPFLKKIMS